MFASHAEMHGFGQLYFAEPARKLTPDRERIAMIGYVTLGTNDLAKATEFYDALLGEMGAKRLFQTDTLSAYGFGKDKPLLTINTPFDKGAANVGNGVMVALNVGNPGDVDRLFAKAIELGATSEGDPGPRGASFYGAYFRDLDGNKLNFYVFS